MKTVTSGKQSQNSALCNPVDENGNIIRDPATLSEHEKFKSWVECIFGSQKNYSKKCGYSRKAINEFCQGKKTIPESLKLSWLISLKCEDIKQENARLKRRIFLLENANKKELTE